MRNLILIVMMVLGTNLQAQSFDFSCSDDSIISIEDLIPMINVDADVTYEGDNTREYGIAFWAPSDYVHPDPKFTESHTNGYYQIKAATVTIDNGAQNTVGDNDLHGFNVSTSLAGNWDVFTLNPFSSSDDVFIDRRINDNGKYHGYVLVYDKHMAYGRAALAKWDVGGTIHYIIVTNNVAKPGYAAHVYDNNMKVIDGELTDIGKISIRFNLY